SATRATHVPAVWLRRYPRLRPRPILMNTGFLAIGNLSRDERVSRIDDRVDRAIRFSHCRAATSVPEVSRRREDITRYDQSEKSVKILRALWHFDTAGDNQSYYSMPSHGGNTGSNPVGDANYFK